MAAAAPANWSIEATGTTSVGPASSATSGTPAGVRSSARAAVSCGAITRIPSTPRIRRRSTASSTDARSNAFRLAIVMK